MSDNCYYIYTDASFDKGHGIGISGSLLFKSSDDHDGVKLSDKDVILKSFIEKNNIRAEIRGAIFALELFAELTPGVPVQLYTDCQTISNLESRRKKLESSKFISKSKNTPLPNTDLYKKLFELFDKVKPTIKWVPGHSPLNSKDLVQRNFSILDKAVRKKLRQTV